MARPTSLEIDLGALQHNYAKIKHFAPTSKVVAMVKANAYGHGLDCIVPSINADAFGVACIDEALAIRKLGVSIPVVLLEGIFNESELQAVAENQFEIVVHHTWQVELLEKAKINKPIAVWLKINTGMNRLGFQAGQVKDIWQRLNSHKNIINNIRLMTHFSSADELGNQQTNIQFQEFSQATRGLIAEKSAANSAAILAWPDTHGDWVRPGIMLYGITPFAEKTAEEFDLKPVMTLRSEIISINQLKKSDKVGYGGTWECPHDMQIGIIAVGYGDGYPRHAKNGTPVLVNNKIVPVVGRISMDMMAVDVSSQPNIKIGDPVVLWGKGLPIEKVALHADTIPYELLCNIAERINRKIIS